MVHMQISGAATRPPAAQAILDSATTAMLWFDAERRLCWLNPAAEDLLGISLLATTPPRLNQVFAGAPELRHALNRAHSESGQLSLREYPLIVAEDREIGRVDCQIAPMGDGLLLELVPRERPGRIQFEAAQQERRDAARHLVRSLAHEIRNPLGGLRGAAQLLGRRLDDPGLRDHTRVILDEADRIGTLVERLLGPEREQRRRVNLHEPLEHVRRLLAADLPAGASLVTEYDPSLPEISADPDQLIQILLNLASNGVRAAGEGGHIVLRSRVLRQYTIAGRCHRLAVAAEIADDGPGVPDQLRETLFYPMVTGTPGGEGLGLAIANELAARQGGLLSWESRSGDTRFRLVLPVADS